MIREIYCSKFKKPLIVFKEGLNVILGDENGANSIGKSTALLVIDYILGGDDYHKTEDIINNVQHHEVGVCFEFNDNKFYFVRDTRYTDTVFLADELYQKAADGAMTLSEYKNYLNENYQLNLYESTFRMVVGLFMRIYGKENDNEEKPLHEVYKMKDEDCIIRLVKILNSYKEIYEQKKNLKEIKERNAAFTRAMKLNLIHAAKNKTEAKNMKSRIESIKQELDVLTMELAAQSVSLDTTQMQIVLSIKEQLYKLQTQKTASYFKILRYQHNLDATRKKSVIDMVQLKKFFPSANIMEINKINQFHSGITEIVASDLKNQINEETARYKNLETKEKELLDSIKPTIQENAPSKLAVQQMANLQREMLNLIDSSSSFDKNASYRKECADAEVLYKSSFQTILTKVQQEINNSLEQYCHLIYGENKTAPLITLLPNKYIFKTPNDRGTGTQYRGLIMFDLVMLTISLLPVICHDSFLLKNIEDEAIEKLLDIYTSFTDKQIFIAFDKQNSYTAKVSQLLNDNCVLRLSAGGNELYGKSWSRS